MNNILTAIKAIVESPGLKYVRESNNVIQNRANQMGASFEEDVKDAFANCIGKDQITIKKERSETFSYLGRSTTPPDAILMSSDAIEIKKLESSTSSIQLNSSYPKNKLHSTNPKICTACRECEEWDVKDMLYVIGIVNKQILKSIFFIYGDLYCDANEIYDNVEKVIKNRIQTIDGFELADTNELARINNIDHLGITDLRVRGMWIIKSPFNYFEYLIGDQRDSSFKLVALIPEEKYNSFDNVEEFENFSEEYGIDIVDDEIEDPQNPANLINVKLIKYYI